MPRIRPCLRLDFYAIFHIFPFLQGLWRKHMLQSIFGQVPMKRRIEWEIYACITYVCHDGWSFFCSSFFFIRRLIKSWQKNSKLALTRRAFVELSRKSSDRRLLETNPKKSYTTAPYLDTSILVL